MAVTDEAAVLHEFFTVSTTREADGWVAWSDSLTKNDEEQSPVRFWAPTRSGAISAWLGRFRDVLD